MHITVILFSPNTSGEISCMTQTPCLANSIYLSHVGLAMFFKLLHAIESAFIFLPHSWVLYVNGKERITDCPSVNDGNWHHIAVTWTCMDGAWRVYIDGKLSDGGSGLSVGSKIPGMLCLCYPRSVA